MAASTSRASARWQRSRGLPTGALWGLLAVGVTLPAIAGLGLVGARAARTRRARRRSSTEAPALPSAPDRPSRQRAADVEAFVRQSLVQTLGPEARTLSRVRLAARLREAGADESAEALDRVLADVERARFASAPLPPGTEDAAREALAGI